MAAKDDWRLCADWLVRCNILSFDHKVTSESAQVFDLAQTLRDGVLICHLLNRLNPGSIDPKEFSQRPQMSQFLCRKNIRVFLQTCKKSFGLEDRDLFEPYDLFEVKDFGKVIKTLSRLSNAPQAKKSGIPNYLGFNVREEEDDVYGHLPQYADSNPLEDDLYDVAPADDDAAELIYEDLTAIQRKGQKPSSQREYCIKELVETENNYVDALDMICTHFIGPLKNVLSENDHSVIFYGIDKLNAIHTGFHSDLHKACTQRASSTVSTSTVTISDCFVKWKESFLMYGDFCSNLPKAQEQVDELCTRNPAMQTKIVDCQMKANQGKFRLRDLLSVPMQRVLKYHLLLRELIKNTPREHPEKQSLEKALEEMQDLSLYVNEVKRDNEALQLINEIQNSIQDLQMPAETSLKDYGRLLLDGELKVKKHDDTSRNNKTRYVFLFDKVMLMCKSRIVDKFFWGDNYSFKDALVLSQYNVDENRKNQVKTEKGWQFAFILVERSGAYASNIFTKTEDMKRKWIDAINMAQDNTAPSGRRDGGHDFIMASFDEPTICDVCRKLLRGVFYQGYKCCKTNLVVHKECISKSKDIKDFQKSSATGPPVIPPKIPPNMKGESPTPPSRWCRAHKPYTGRPPPENGRPPLMFKAQEEFEVLMNTDDYWWEGRLNSRQGVFPKEYVAMLTGGGARKQPQPPTTPRRRSSDIRSTPLPLIPQDSIVEEVEQPLSPPPPAHHGSGVRYINVDAEGGDFSVYPWFVGQQARDQATKKLESLRSGTFLIRESITSERRGEYALSIKYGTVIKHIKVMRSPDHRFFLADCLVFQSIPALVEYYQNHTLENSFPELPTVLALPYKDAVRELKDIAGAAGPGGPANHVLGKCQAMYDYAANQPNQLSLRAGDTIDILSKAGGDRGWWKGQIREKVGYFPSAYVEEEEDGAWA